MKHLESAPWWVPARMAVVGVIASVLSCGEAQSRCETVEDHLRACGRQGTVDFCEGELNGCLGECILDASCAELEDSLAPFVYCIAGCGGDFTCDRGDTSISSRWRCDGELDCLDGADEANCSGRN